MEIITRRETTGSMMNLYGTFRNLAMKNVAIFTFKLQLIHSNQYEIITVHVNNFT